MIQLWTCPQCNTNNILNHAFCPSCGTPQPLTNQQQPGNTQNTQPLSQQQVTYIIMPNSNPTFNQTISSSPPTPTSQLLQNLFNQMTPSQMVGVLLVIVSIFGYVAYILSTLFPLASINYFYFQTGNTQPVAITIGFNEGIVVAEGVTPQDTEHPQATQNHIPVRYDFFYVPQTVQVTLPYGYIEYVSPVWNTYSELCKHMQRAVQNGIALGISCST